MTRSPATDLDWGLRRLHLPTIRRLYPPLITLAEKESWTYKELLEQLISEEIAHRAETRIERATRKAKFPYLKTLEEFDFTFQRSIERKTLGRYLGSELVEQGRCLLLLGRPGRGKTHLAIGIAYKAIQAGYDARFTTAAQLLSQLDRAAREGLLDNALRDFVDPHVLVIDELGYLGYGPDAANALFQVVDQRYIKRRPVLITTNKEPDAWGAVLHDSDLAEAIVDRLLERGELLRLRGKSYRNPHRQDVPPPGEDAVQGTEEP